MRRRILIILVAAVFAGLSAVAVVAYTNGADRRAIEGKKGVWVLLAIDTIPAETTGAQIRSRRLARQVLMPAEAVPDGALAKIDDELADRALNTMLHPDQMLMAGQFAEASAPAPSASPTFALPADKIAISVELGIAPQVAGQVDPGDEVTVFLTYPKAPKEGALQTTLALLSEIPVLNVGEKPAPNAWPTSTPVPAPAPSASPAEAPEPEELERYVVTMAVTQPEATKLIFGSNTGLLHLGLLGPSASVAPVTDEELQRILQEHAAES
jgi:pilus assembly protein CpaB